MSILAGKSSIFLKSKSLLLLGNCYVTQWVQLEHCETKIKKIVRDVRIKNIKLNFLIFWGLLSIVLWK